MGAGFLFLATVSFAAMDVGRLHQWDAVPVPVSMIALAIFAVALSSQARGMIVNFILLSGHSHSSEVWSRRDQGRAEA